MAGLDEASCWRTPALMYQHGLWGAFFVNRAAETAHGGYATLIAFGTSAQTPGGIL